MGLNYKAVSLNDPTMYRDLPRSSYGVKVWTEIRNGLYEPLYVLTKVGDIRYVQNRDRDLTYEGVIVLLHIQFDTGGSIDVKALADQLPQITGSELLIEELERGGRFHKGASLNTGTSTLSLEWKVPKEEFDSGLIIYIKELEIAMSINYNRTHHIEHPLDSIARLRGKEFSVELQAQCDCGLWLNERDVDRYFVLVDGDVLEAPVNIVPGESFVSYNGRTLSINDALRAGIIFLDKLSAIRCRDIYSSCGLNMEDMSLPRMVQLLENMSVDIKGIVVKDKAAEHTNSKTLTSQDISERKATLELEAMHRGAAYDQVKDDYRTRTLRDSYERDKVTTLIKDTQELNNELNAARKQTVEGIKSIVDISKKVAGAF